jgi:CRP/FNR family transcriptional regulator, cyclic AMP receptor protein
MTAATSTLVPPAPTRHSDRDPLAGSNVFGVLDEADRAYLTERVRRVEAGRGQVVLCEGTPSDSVLLLLTGRLKVVTYSEEGDEFIISTVLPGETIGEMGVLSGRPRSATVEATVPSTLLVLPGSVIAHMIEKRPVFAIAMLERLSEMVSSVTGTASDLVHLDLSQRVAKHLLQSTAGSDRGDSLGTTQADIAASVGASRQRVNGCLREFERNGWIAVERQRLTVRDRAALAEVVSC